MESKIGVGTTFNIFLKAADKKEGAIVGLNKAKSRKSGRVLVMDDNDMLRDFLKEALDALGYEVSCAKDGQEAIKTVRSRPADFDVAILDLTVPGNMGGKEAIREIRKFAPDLKAIVTSGYNNDPVMADYKNYGFDDFIIKPFNVEELKQVLRKVLY
ncbi:MAG TPA: response regulator [Firmicutes bacterium]|nr:response regulator [Bacillota bacterium]